MISMLRRLRARFDRGRFEREMDDELRFHLESMIKDSIEAGMSPEEARRSALLSFGGLDKTKEQCRDTRWTHLLDDFWQDSCYAARTLLKNRGFAFAAIGTRLGSPDRAGCSGMFYPGSESREGGSDDRLAFRVAKY